MEVLLSFFMPKFKHKEVLHMFSDIVLEKILCREEVMRIPCEHKSVMLHAIEEVLEEENLLKEEAKSEYE